MMLFDWHYALELLPSLLRASLTTLAVTLAGFVIALTVGLVLALSKRSRVVVLAYPARAVIEFLRSTPLLIQVYFVYYVLPEFGLALSALQAGVIGIGLHYAAYLAEVYRGGLESVPAGQWEAASALSMRPYLMYRRVILPQAVRPILPPIGNYLVAMLKETTVLSAITVVDIMQQAKNMASESFRYLEPITLVGAFFLCMAITLSVGVRFLESRLEVKP